MQPQQNLSFNLGGVSVSGDADPSVVSAAVEQGVDRAVQKAAKTLRVIAENNVPEA